MLNRSFLASCVALTLCSGCHGGTTPTDAGGDVSGLDVPRDAGSQEAGIDTPTVDANVGDTASQDTGIDTLTVDANVGDTASQDAATDGSPLDAVPEASMTDVPVDAPPRMVDPACVVAQLTAATAADVPIPMAVHSTGGVSWVECASGSNDTTNPRICEAETMWTGATLTVSSSTTTDVHLTGTLSRARGGPDGHRVVCEFPLHAQQ